MILQFTLHYLVFCLLLVNTIPGVSISSYKSCYSWCYLTTEHEWVVIWIQDYKKSGSQLFLKFECLVFGSPLYLKWSKNVRNKFQINPTEWWNEARPHLTIYNVVRLFKFCVLVIYTHFLHDNYKYML